MNIGRIFGRKPGSEGGENPEPRYFEVYGDYLVMVQILRRLCLGLLCANGLLLLLLRNAERKAPVVIRVSDLGEAKAINVTSEEAVTKPEVLAFVKLFMKFFLERNYYTWKDNLLEAGGMMTGDFRDRMNRDPQTAQDTAMMESNRLTTKLKFSDIEVSRETADAIIVTVKGWRQITSYEDAQYLKETIFQAELVLKKGPRTSETPYGLLVDSYKQTAFKDETSSPTPGMEKPN